MNVQREAKRLWASLIPLVAAFALAPAALSAQEVGTIAGTVVDATSQEPLAGAQVFIPAPEQGAVAGSSFGTITDARGRFIIRNVPAGQHTVRVDLIGYSAASRTVTVESGEVSTVNFRIDQTALELDEIVVTGVAGATPKAKVPFEVAKIQVEDMPVPRVNAASALQSQVAGARVISATGQPGQTQSITLRGATSINAGGRSQGPLLIVDGVILGSSNLAEIAALDIESIEVVKGAAAASLYGSRAANGVIQIQTKRGTDFSDNVTRYTVRQEFGASSLGNKIELAKSHRLRMNADGTSFLDAAGNEVGYGQAALIQDNTSLAFLDEPFPGQTFDQIDRFFDPGDFAQTYVSMEGRTGNTNYYGSFSNFSESGIVRYNQGYNRQNFRLNLDHGLREDLQLSVSSFYSTSWQDLLDTGGGATPFFNLTFVPPNIDLLQIDSTTGELEVNPNPRSLEDNPLYAIRYRELERERQRFMSSGLIRYAPVTWFDLEANVSYDRYNLETNIVYPKGYARGSVDPSSLTPGQITEDLDINEALNASATASLYYTIGDLTTRTRARYLYESQHRAGFTSQGSDLVVAGVPSLDVAVGDKQVGSYVQDIRSEGYFLITALDYADKYILDALIRRDGSSLFGSEERWQTYGRVSGAWRMGMEPWFQIPGLNELKLRGSYGTAGGRPNFSAQYETYGVSQGNLVPSTLGNANLRPEFSREIEVGLDAELFDRVSIGLTYADTRTEDQILPVPLPGFAGFSSQWRNAGTLESTTWEATLEASLIQSGDFSWFSRLLLDQTNTEITHLNVPPFQAGSSSAYFIREGEKLGTIYGDQWATSCGDLPEAAQAFCDEFRVNSDGYFVWTGGEATTAGPGPDGTVGTSDDLWGTPCPAAIDDAVSNSVGCEYGMPVLAMCEDDAGEPTDFCPIGNTLPDLNFSFSNNISWKGLSLYALFDASMGFDIYNQTIQWAYREESAGPVDVRGLPESEKKPVGYYLNQYDVNAINSHFVEDGSFVKLRELALRYTLSDNILSSLPGLRDMESVTLSLIGRNLYTFTDYTGYDPEVGNPNSIFQSAAIDRFDGYQYPNFRTITGSVEITF